jgi:hypothetical protein
VRRIGFRLAVLNWVGVSNGCRSRLISEWNVDRRRRFFRRLDELSRAGLLTVKMAKIAAAEPGWRTIRRHHAAAHKQQGNNARETSPEQSHHGSPSWLDPSAQCAQFAL